jgi:hypothetical protein
MRSNGFLSRLSSVPPIGKPARRRRRRSPRLESLEGRLVLSSLTVTSAADSGPGTLRAVIAQAQAGDTITFSSRLDGQTISLTGGELAIDENMTIEGPGAGLIDVDAGGKNRVFDISSASATVTISGLTISGGNSEDGGGIVDQGGTLTLTGDALSKDEAIGVNPGDTVQGGAVEVTDSGTLNVSSSRFVEDLAQGAAGANGGTAPVNGTGGDGDGGAIFADVGTSLTVTGCTFISNQAIGGAGGAGGGGFENGAGGNGNGSAIDTSGVAFSVTDSTFKGDLALGGAGATGLAAQPYTFNGTGGGASGTIIIGSLIADSPFTFSSDTFSGEQAIGGAGANSTGPGFANYGGAGGGAGGIINNNDGMLDMTIQNCTFTHNLGQAGAGGSSDFGGEGGNGSGALIFTGGNLTIVGSTFTGNQAIGYTTAPAEEATEGSPAPSCTSMATSHSATRRSPTTWRSRAPAARRAPAVMEDPGESAPAVRSSCMPSCPCPAVPSSTTSRSVAPAETAGRGVRVAPADCRKAVRSTSRVSRTSPHTCRHFR